MSPTRTAPPAAIERDPRWARVQARDRSADGKFWYSVRTTGVFCRPSCAARAAKPKNVQFHASPAAARAAGFRPCKRCMPEGISLDAQNARLIAKACKIIEKAEELPKLSELAAAVNLSEGYFHRLFKAHAGVTPRAYAAAHRASRVRQGIVSKPSITQAIYDAGFNSNGRFYAAAPEILGMSPKHFRQGGHEEEIRFAVGQCALGAILVASSKKGVVSVLLDDDPESLVRSLQDAFPKAHLVGADKDYENLIAQVVGMVESPGMNLELPLDIRGTVFQQKVWRALRKIPAGQTTTYQEIARKIGAPSAVRAVAGACAANRIAIAIPCHRVVRRDGALSGYRWGVERRRALLERESAGARGTLTPEAGGAAHAP